MCVAQSLGFILYTTLMKDGDWTLVCFDGELLVRGVRVVVLAGINVAVFRTEDGELRAIEDRCPHRGAPLSRGLIYDNDKVACADHGWSICLVNGHVEPPERGQVKTFKVQVEGGVVMVR